MRALPLLEMRQGDRTSTSRMRANTLDARRNRCGLAEACGNGLPEPCGDHPRAQIAYVSSRDACGGMPKARVSLPAIQQVRVRLLLGPPASYHWGLARRCLAENCPMRQLGAHCRCRSEWRRAGWLNHKPSARAPRCSQLPLPRRGPPPDPRGDTSVTPSSPRRRSLGCTLPKNRRFAS